MIQDWDDSYTNGAYIEDGASYPAKWDAAAKAFRAEMLTAGLAEPDLRYGPAARETPALLRPMENCSVTCRVGSAERPEFLRQNDLLANIWTGLGADMRSVHAEGRHHFDVIDGLADPASKLTGAFVG